MNCELGDQWMIQGLPVLDNLSAHQPFGGVSHFWVNDKCIFIFSAPTVSVVDADPDRMQIQWGP